MGTYDIFLADLGLSTDYKSVALPIELRGQFNFRYNIIIVKMKYYVLSFIWLSLSS